MTSTSDMGAATDRYELAQAYRQAEREGALARYWKRRWQRAAEMAAWLSEDELPSLTAEQGMVLYRASGGSRSKEFAANPATEVRDTLDFLLYDTITLEARFNECVADGGAYKLEGVGKEFVPPTCSACDSRPCWPSGTRPPSALCDAWAFTARR